MPDDNTNSQDSQDSLDQRDSEAKLLPVAELAEHRKDLEEHLAKYLGNKPMIFHELVSSVIHIDIYVYPPSENRNYYTLVTMGMSDLPMKTPDIWGEPYAELVICLPNDWPLKHSDFDDENNYWPIRTLKSLARFPHDYGTWLGWGHSLPHHEDSPIINTLFSGYILGYPLTTPAEFRVLELEDKDIHFYAVYPIYDEEVQFKLTQPSGAKALLSLFESKGYTELVDVHRSNLISRHQS